jgi:hypothetical protein
VTVHTGEPLFVITIVSPCSAAATHLRKVLVCLSHRKSNTPALRPRRCARIRVRASRAGLGFTSPPVCATSLTCISLRLNVSLSFSHRPTRRARSITLSGRRGYAVSDHGAANRRDRRLEKQRNARRASVGRTTAIGNDKNVNNPH